MLPARSPGKPAIEPVDDVTTMHMKPHAVNKPRATSAQGDQPSPAEPAGAAPPPRLLDALRHAIRVRHDSIRTEESYVDWARRFIRFHGLRYARELGASGVAAFLTHWAVDRSAAPSTQNQLRSALMFLYREVLEPRLPWLDVAAATATSAASPSSASAATCACARSVRDLSPQARIAGQLGHAFGTSDVTQRRGHEGGIIILECGLQLRGHVRFGLEVFGGVPADGLGRGHGWTPEVPGRVAS